MPKQITFKIRGFARESIGQFDGQKYNTTFEYHSITLKPYHFFMKDLFGKALYNYVTGISKEDLITETSISEEDILPISYLFRGYDQMPSIEQKALALCRGSVLDIGAGSGSHSLYLQEVQKMDVTALDNSKGSIQCCQQRGILKTIHMDVFDLKDVAFDTLLMLMNGSGLFGTYQEVTEKLKQLKNLLKAGGQILIDSSDIIYMFDQDEDGGHWVSTENDYYGELEYTLKYQGESQTTSWLYLDFNSLAKLSEDAGLHCELILKGDHFDYLAKLSIK